jgi:hypothetical protein
MDGYSQITVLVFRDHDGHVIGWATNTSAGQGALPTTIPDFFPNGALCYLIALFMRNIFFFWEKGMMLPYDFISFVRENKIGDINGHKLFDRDDFIKLAASLRVVLTIENDFSRLEGASVFGTPGYPVLEKVHLRVRDRHYIVPVLDDMPEEKKTRSISAPLEKIACGVCTFLNPADTKNCGVCETDLNAVVATAQRPAAAPAQRQAAPARRQAAPAQRQAAPAAPAPPTEIACKACTVLNPVGTENCEMCGTSFTGGRDVTRLG